MKIALSVFACGALLLFGAGCPTRVSKSSAVTQELHPLPQPTTPTQTPTIPEAAKNVPLPK